MLYDIIIIGGGVIGCGILRELSRYRIKALLLECSDDVSCGASRANSGIVHAGYDCEPNTLKARFNVEGNKMFQELCQELNVPFQNIGSLVVADKDGLERLKILQDKGNENGVLTNIISRDEIVKIEPNIADHIEYALYAPSASIVSPYKLTLALADSAILNGAKIKLENRVVDCRYNKDIKEYQVITNKDSYRARMVINSAGTHSMAINKIVGAETYPTEFRRGEYFVLDPSERRKVNHIIFPLPDERGKGILITPTADGNVLYGPTSIVTESPDDINVTIEGLNQIREGVKRSFRGVDFKKTIRVFAGLRSISGNDFIIKHSSIIENYIMLLGICSPGLSSAPAIAKYVVELIGNRIDLEPKGDFKELPKHRQFIELSIEELNELVKEDPRWGRIICRCEKVSEREIVDAIHAPLGAYTVDAIKRRTRSGMGRCQGGFCTPRIIEILSRELNIPITKVRLRGEGSEFAIGEIKDIDL